MLRHARKSQWVIVQENDAWSAYRNNRSVITGARSIDTVKQAVRRARAVHDKVILIEEDGYRVDITSEFSGARERRSPVR